MAWKIPERVAKKLRKYAIPLTSKDYNFSYRVRVFHALLKPLLGWARKSLKEAGLEEHEIDSELYIICWHLLKEYKPYKSSIVPYLRKQVPWKIASLLERIRKCNTEIPSGLITKPEESYSMPNEIYLSVPNILFEDRWLGKNLQKCQKYLIYRLLVADSHKREDLAEDNALGRWTIFNRISELRDILKERGVS